MAGEISRRGPSGILGGAIAALIVGIMLSTLLVLRLQAGQGRLSAGDWAAVRFSLVQALVSAVVSVGLALPVAQAVARRQFRFRSALIAALGAPFLLPVIVAALGLLAIFGRNGLVNSALVALGLPEISIYGFHGVVLAHVFLNLPLAVRMLLHGWKDIPAERVRLAQSLGLGPQDFARHVTGPMLRQVVPGALLAVFLVCLTSFAVVLILGGGPRATTIELAIYQAIRFDFDLGRAALMAAVQLAICLLAVLAAARWSAPQGIGGGLDRRLDLPAPLGWRRGMDALWIMGAALFLLAPLATVMLRGIPSLLGQSGAVWQAALTSVLMALAVALLTGAMAVGLGSVAGREGRFARAVEAAGMLPMAASALVLGTGLFLILYPFIAPSALALPVAVGVNTLLALPFALRLILPAWRQAEVTQGRLADSLGLVGLPRLRHAILPRLRRPLGLALGLAAALSMGDLGVIALFSTDQGATLPLQVWRLMGSYRTSEAEAAALLLVILSFGVFLIFDIWGRWRAEL